jgi:hypothetical protein
MTIAGVRLDRRLMTASDTKSDAENAFAREQPMQTCCPSNRYFRGNFCHSGINVSYNALLIAIFAIVNDHFKIEVEHMTYHVMIAKNRKNRLVHTLFFRNQFIANIIVAGDKQEEYQLTRSTPE